MFKKITSGCLLNKSSRVSNEKNQNDYLAKSKVIITEMVELIKDKVTKKHNLENVFFNLLLNLASHRQKIALEHNTSHADAFGQTRQDVSFTSMHQQYEEYNKKLIIKIKEHLLKLNSIQEIKQEPIIINENLFSIDQKTWMEISVLPEDRIKWGENPEYVHLNLLYLIFNIENNLQVIREEQEESLTNEKNILITIRYKNDGIVVPLTRYYLKIQLPITAEDLSESKNFPICTLIHQEPIYNKNVLSEVVLLFKKAIEYDQENLADLTKIISQITYLFSHAMPYRRGSAAISEWLETIIFSYHGYEISYHSELNVNLEALTSQIHEFVEKYPNMINISPLARSSPTLKS